MSITSLIIRSLEEDGSVFLNRAEVEQVLATVGALIGQIEKATARALSAEARAEAAEREVERLGEIITECDGIECIKHDPLVRYAIQQQVSAEADAARMRQVIEAVEWGGLRFIPGDDGMDRCCPSCDGFIERGHKPECILFAALAAPAPQEERSAKSCIHPSSYCEVCQAENSASPQEGETN